MRQKDATIKEHQSQCNYKDATIKSLNEQIEMLQKDLQKSYSDYERLTLMLEEAELKQAEANNLLEIKTQFLNQFQ